MCIVSMLYICSMMHIFIMLTISSWCGNVIRMDIFIMMCLCIMMDICNMLVIAMLCVSTICIRIILDICIMVGSIITMYFGNLICISEFSSVAS